MSNRISNTVKGPNCLHNLVLSLVLTFQWYAATKTGGKRIEYRAMSAWWKPRIWELRSEITHVRFYRGMTKETLEFLVDKIDIGPCPIPKWKGQYYRIHFSQNTKLINKAKPV